MRVEYWNNFKNEIMLGDDVSHNQDGSINTTKERTIRQIIDNTQIANDELSESKMSFILNLVRKVLPNIIATEIAGFQTTGSYFPIGQIHTLRMKQSPDISYDEQFKDLNRVPTPEEIAEYHSKATYEKNRTHLQILREVVEFSKKLYSQEPFAKIALDNDDSLNEKAFETINELDNVLLNTIFENSDNPTHVFDMSKIGGTPTFVGDVHAALAILINRQANMIAQKTRRGAGNWCVISPTALTILQSATTSAFARTSGGVFNVPSQYDCTTNIKFVGTLNNAMRVYVNPYWSDDTDVLVGYKGSDIDAGLFYTPSNMFAIDEETGKPYREDHILMKFGDDFNNTKNYFGRVGIDVSTLTFLL